MATIKKSGEAPEGTIHVGVGAVGFKVTDEKPYESDDLAVIEAAERNPYLTVEFDEAAAEADAKAAARAESREHDKLRKAQLEAEKEIAKKDAVAPAPEIPVSPEDLNESDDSNTTKGGRK